MIRDSLIRLLLLTVIVGVIFSPYATDVLRRRIVDTYKHKNIKKDYLYNLDSLKLILLIPSDYFIFCSVFYFF